MVSANYFCAVEPGVIPVIEKPLTVFLNGLEITTVATIGDHADCLALGYLVTHGFLRPEEVVVAIDVEPDLDLAVVRTAAPTAHEAFVRGRTLVSNCAYGTAIDRLLATLNGIIAPPLPCPLAKLAQLAATVAAWQERQDREGQNQKRWNGLHTGVLWQVHSGAALATMRDHGRLSVLDSLAGLVRRDDLDPSGCLLWTSGRLSAECVIKAAHLGVPALAGPGPASDWAMRLAAQVGLELVHLPVRTFAFSDQGLALNPL
ncbi:putative Sulfur carrier protein FdhD [uncultured Gammaproteobacteria bacterium]